MQIIDQKNYFNSTYKSWINISEEKATIIKKTIDKLGISEGASVLDVASGTGVLYEFLREKKIKRYVAIDIAENMLEELKSHYGEAEVICTDFEKPLELEEKFDAIIIFNSIPHFENLHGIFENASKHLFEGGVFAIAHSTTREGLREHHKKINYVMDRDAIPKDEVLKQVAEKFKFKDLVFEDSEFFYFSCRK